MTDSAISTFQRLGIPLTVSSILCIGLVALVVAAWLPVKKFGEIEFAEFTSKQRKWLRWASIPLAVATLLGYLPCWYSTDWNSEKFADVMRLLPTYMEKKEFRKSLDFYKSKFAGSSERPETVLFYAVLDTQATPKREDLPAAQQQLYDERRKLLEEYGAGRTYRFYTLKFSTFRTNR